MRISSETLDDLKAQGIIVSPFPSDEAEQAYREKWLRDHENMYKYKGASRHFDLDTRQWIYEGKPVDGWQAALAEGLEKHLTSTTSWHGKWYDSETMYIRKGDMLTKRKVGKSKFVSKDEVLKYVARDMKAYTGAYGEFAININKMFAEKFGRNLGWIYPSTYGIGVWVFCNYSKQKCIDSVREVLDSMNIEYRNEFSDANFVYRFVISKKAVNRKRLIA